MAGVKPLLETIGALLPKGIKAWHASPHDFDKVDLSKIGTGQGAASYGPGFYAAESEAVSGRGGEYWKEFANRGSSGENTAAEYLARAGFDRQKAAQTLRERLAEPTTGISEHNVNMQKRMRQEALSLLESDKHVGPRVYELNLKADPRSFLQWDEPLAGQKVWERLDPKVRSSIDEFAESKGHNAFSDAPEEYKGHELWRALKHHDVHESLPPVIGKSDWYKGNTDEAQHSMEYLKSLDAPGIRYLDQQSRPLGPANDPAAQRQIAALTANIERLRSLGDNLKASELDQTRARLQRGLDTPRTYNYVVNNPDIIEIMRKLAIPGMVTGGAASVYQPQGQQ